MYKWGTWKGFCVQEGLTGSWACLLSCVQLFATLWTIACRAPPLTMGFPEQEYRRGLPFPSPGNLLDPAIKLTSLVSPALQETVFTVFTSDSKNSICNAGDLGSVPRLGRFPGEGKGYPLQYSGLENFMDYGSWGPKELDRTVQLFMSIHLTLGSTDPLYCLLFH